MVTYFSIKRKIGKFFLNNSSSNIFSIPFYKNHFFIITIYSLFISLLGVWDSSSQSLIAHDESLYSVRAKTINETNDWFVPFSEPHHKTIGSYWLIALCIRSLGLNEYSVRLPSSIFSLLCSLIIYLIVSDLLDRNKALYSSLFLSSMPLWIQYSRYASPDIPYIFFLLLSIYFLNKTLFITDKSKLINFLLIFSGFSLTICFTLRSLMILLPIISLSPYYYYVLKKYSNKGYYYFIFGLFIGFLLNIFPIYLAYLKFGNSAITTLFSFASRKAIGSSNFNGFSFYPLKVLLMGFPVSLLSIFGFYKFIKSKNLVSILFFIICPLLMLVFLSLMSSSYAHYSLPVYPFLAVLSSQGFIYLKDNYHRIRNISKYFIVFYVLILCILLTSVFALASGIIEFNVITHNIIFKSIIIYTFIIFILVIYSSFNHFRLQNSKLIPFRLLCLFQTILLTSLYSTGFMGNPNSALKGYVRQNSNIFSSENKIMLIDLDSKKRNLFKFYLPKSMVVKELISPIFNEYFVLINSSKLDKLKSDSKLRFKYINKFQDISLIKILN